MINTVFANMEKYGSEKDDQTVVKEVVEFLVLNVVSIDQVCFSLFSIAKF